jgi:Mg-chelatase subunit ChlD
MQAYSFSGIRGPSHPELFTEKLQEALVMAGMVSLRNDLAVEFGDWWSFNWQTNVITLPKRELASAPEAEICWVILHEAAHASLTRLHHILPEKTLHRNEIQVLLNCIEDIRIENWLVERFPGSRQWKSVAQEIAVRADPKSTESAAQENPAVGFLRGLLRFGESGRLPAHLNRVSKAALEECLPSLTAAFACVPPSANVREASVDALYGSHPVSRCYTAQDQMEEASPFEKWVRILQASMWAHVAEGVLPTFLKLVQQHGCPQLPATRVIRVCRARGRKGTRPMPEELKRALRKQLRQTGAGDYWQTVAKYGEQIRSITDLLLRLLPNHRGLKHVRGRRTGDRLDLRVAAQFEVDRRLYDKLWMQRIHRTLPEPVFVFAMDCSQSMSRHGRATAAYESIVVMREACKRAGIPFSVINFNDETEVLLGWEHPDDTKSQTRLLALLQPDGGTDIASSLEAADEMLKERCERNQFVFLMTDGEVKRGQIKEVKSCNARLAKNGVEVLAFGLGSDAEDISLLYPQAELVRDATALPRAFSSTLVRAIRRLS